jgi:hypothetical protein
MYKFNCTFFECLNIIYNDFALGKINIDIKPKILLKNDIILNSNINKKIDIIDKPFTIDDYNYWGKYHISLELLQEYDVFSCSYVFLTKNDKIITFETKKDNPQYAYRFTYDGEYYYKIYKPLEENKKYKWLFSGFKDIIEGYDQLPLYGDLLILTKSLKDCMSYNVCGYPAISLQGETNILKGELVHKLLKRFNKIILNYDNDQEGIKNTIKINNEYGFRYFYIPKYKDLSDFIEHMFNKCSTNGRKIDKNEIKKIKVYVDVKNNKKILFWLLDTHFCIDVQMGVSS